MHVNEVSPADVRRRLDQRERLVLLDCREHDELRLARIAGAVHIPMGDIARRAGELDPDVECVVFCHHGVRSRSVAAFLQQQGFARVSSMRGGIDAWSEQLDPSVPRYA
ncbi:MAG: Sulfurtransferase [Phycisphaerae bacterium]|nr:Sulfurtransferase [Phycisphaerae bacterium]